MAQVRTPRSLSWALRRRRWIYAMRSFLVAWHGSARYDAILECARMASPPKRSDISFLTEGHALLLTIRGWEPHMVRDFIDRVVELMPGSAFGPEASRTLGTRLASNILIEGSMWQRGEVFAYLTGPEAFGWLMAERTRDMLADFQPSEETIGAWANRVVEPYLTHMDPMTALLAYEARIDPAEITEPPTEDTLAGWRLLVSLGT